VDSSDLFDDPVRVERVRKVSSAVDDINSAYGKHAVHIASSNIVANKLEHSRNIMAWRKRALLKGESFRRRLGIPLLKLK
jgi:hypothetical protein